MDAIERPSSARATLSPRAMAGADSSTAERAPGATDSTSMSISVVATGSGVTVGARAAFTDDLSAPACAASATTSVQRRRCEVLTDD